MLEVFLLNLRIREDGVDFFDNIFTAFSQLCQAGYCGVLHEFFQTLNIN